MKSRKLLLFPSSRGGVDATSKNSRRRHPWKEWPGWSEMLLTTPSALHKLASQHFHDAQPPLLWRRGITHLPLFPFRLGNTPFSPRSCCDQHGNLLLIVPVLHGLHRQPAHQQERPPAAAAAPA